MKTNHRLRTPSRGSWQALTGGLLLATSIGCSGPSGDGLRPVGQASDSNGGAAGNGGASSNGAALGNGGSASAGTLGGAASPGALAGGPTWTPMYQTTETTALANPLPPDPIDDTAPPETAFDASLGYQGVDGISRNNSLNRFRFDVMPYADDAEQTRAETLYPSHAQFMQAQLSGVVLPSVQTIVTYVKQLDDTIYAGVEEAVEEGVAPSVQSKRAILRGALEYLAAHRSADADLALVTVAAAARLGGDQPAIPADLSSQVDSTQQAFVAHAAEAKPIGFYSWSAELQGIWQQDRLLQRALPSAASSCALAAAIAAEPARRLQYESLVALYSKLTNPVKDSLLSLLDAGAAGTCSALGAHAFLSASQTPESELFAQLYPGGIPANADLMGDLIAAIRAGTIDLTPKPADGWFEYQLYALETLLVTDKSEERAKVGFTGRYKKRLQEAFSTLLVQHQETHIKQVGPGAPGVDLSTLPPVPQFRLEPLASAYVRHARSYVFLEQALDVVLGAAALDSALAVDAAGKTTETVRIRLRRARDLFYGLYLISAQDLGFQPALGVAGDPAPAEWAALTDAAGHWLVALPGDPLAASDVRVMVPIAALSATRSTYWVVIGVRATVGGYSFINGSDMSVPRPDHQLKAWLPTEQFLEVESSAVPLTRDELRALCDQQKTADAIQAALEARL